MDTVHQKFSYLVNRRKIFYFPALMLLVFSAAGIFLISNRLFQPVSAHGEEQISLNTTENGTPTSLKICNTAGQNIAVGIVLNYNITLEGNPNYRQTVPLQTGPGPFGYCTIVTGPFASGIPPFATFRTNQRVIIHQVELAPYTGPLPWWSQTTLSSQTAPPTVLQANNTTRTAVVTLAGNNNGTFVNEVNFTNSHSTCLPIDYQSAQSSASPECQAPIRRENHFDFNGDRMTDPATFRPATGEWIIKKSDGTASSFYFGTNGDQLVPADYDGDNWSDIAVFRNGYWYIFGSSIGFRSYSYGQAGDVAQPGNFTGFPGADIAVFRPSNGTWYINGGSTVQFGINGDRPVAADYDGDNKTDVAVYRNGTWYILKSSNGEVITINWGIATDKVVPADYDGDGKINPAVYRDGVWYILKADYQNFEVKQFGIATDKPVPADYDGDGKADVAVYREGVWYTLNASNNFWYFQFGNAADIPVQNAFVR